MNGVKRIARRSGGLRTMSWSGWGTIRGAASGALSWRDDWIAPLRRLCCRFSCMLVLGGGTFCAANASATGSGPSPSKNLAIAI